MGFFDSVRRARIDGDTAEPERTVSPRVVSVAEPRRFQTPAFVSLGKGYIPDQVYFRPNAGAQVYEQGSNIVKRCNPKRRLAIY